MKLTSQMKILSFRNCELHCCHLDGYQKESQAFLKRLFAVEKYLAEKPDTARFRIWYNVDETSLDTVLMDEIVASILRIQGYIVKIAFIGLGRIQRWRFIANKKRLPAVLL